MSERIFFQLPGVAVRNVSLGVAGRPVPNGYTVAFKEGLKSAINEKEENFPFDSLPPWQLQCYPCN